MSEGKLYFLFGTVNNTTISAIGYSTMYICYIMEHPWIERYKCLPDPWPWKDEENKETWNKLYWRTIFLYIVNAHVITPLLYAPFYIMNEPLLCDITIEGIPSSAKLFG